MKTKFRAWDKYLKKMFHNVNPIFDAEGNLDFIIYEYECTGYNMTEIGIEKWDAYMAHEKGIPVELMQYTGNGDDTLWSYLSDNEKREWLNKGSKPAEWNGNPIYDGDIARVAFHTGKTTLCKVIYNILHARFEYAVLEMPIITYSFDEVEESRVIGNIHENSELLEGE